MSETETLDLAGQPSVHVTRMAGPLAWGANRKGVQVLINGEHVTLHGDDLDRFVTMMFAAWGWAFNVPPSE